MATLPIFVCELHIPLRCLGPHEKQVKGYPESPATLGQHLRRRRLDLALTQEQAAARFGISVTAYNYWEADRIVPNIAKWPVVIRFLGFDPSPAPTVFGEALGALRRALGLDKRKLAARLAVDVKSILNWEAGKTTPLSGLRKRIAEFAAQCVASGFSDFGDAPPPSADMLTLLAPPGV